MKKTVHCNKIRLNFFSGLIAATLIIPVFSAKAAGTCCETNPNTNTRTYDTILVNTFFGDRKDNIRLYPDADKHVLLISASGKQKKDYQFFLFDMDGRLVTQGTVLNRQTTVFDHLTKGNYLFEIFSDDERIKNGQLSIR